MSYQILVRKDDREILRTIYKMLNINEGDKLILDLKDEELIIKKFDNNIPLSCKNLTMEEIRNRISESLDSIEKGEILQEQEIWDKIAEMKQL